MKGSKVEVKWNQEDDDELLLLIIQMITKVGLDVAIYKRVCNNISKVKIKD